MFSMAPGFFNPLSRQSQQPERRSPRHRNGCEACWRCVTLLAPLFLS